MITRVAMLSAHTSPLEQPGVGDAGGMNVYVLQTARRLARRGISTDIFTKAVGGSIVPVVVEPGVCVRPAEPGGIARALMDESGRYDLLHTHYWLSGHLGLVARERRHVPLVHSMHTMGRVKNRSLAIGDRAESSARIAAESEIVSLADRLVANTVRERDELVDLYGADPTRIDIVVPGVDLDLFRAGRRDVARRRLDLGADEQVVLFAGRLQPHKGPDVLIRALPLMPDTARLVIVGGPSGTGLAHPEALGDLVQTLGLDRRVRVLAPTSQEALADWYAAVDVVCVPSYSESFGLVALEAQACGTPVVAANVGGLPTAVVDGVTGWLVDGHDPRDWASVLRRLLGDEALRQAMGAKAAVHATGFTWDATADRLLASYERAVAR